MRKRRRWPRGVRDATGDAPKPPSAAALEEALEKMAMRSNSDPKPERNRFTLDSHSSITELHALLDSSVKGQESGKWNLSVLLSLHLATCEDDHAGNPTPNAILCGPTGVGKTHSMRTIAGDFALPLVLVDSTSLVPSGIVGMQIEDVMELLYEDAKRILIERELRAGVSDILRLAERGVVFLDEFDKIATPSGGETSSDSNRRQTQRRLLKLVEGATVPVGVRTHTRDIGEDLFLDTSSLLVIAGGAFADMAERTSGRRENSELYRELFPEQRIVAEDIRLYGYLPELVARFPLIIEYDALSARDLLRILAPGSAESPLRLWERYAELCGYTLNVEPRALALIAKLASRLNVGARGLQQLLFPYMSQRFLRAARSGERAISIDVEDLRPDGALYADADSDVSALDMGAIAFEPGPDPIKQTREDDDGPE